MPLSELGSKQFVARGLIIAESIAIQKKLAEIEETNKVGKRNKKKTGWRRRSVKESKKDKAQQWKKASGKKTQ